MTSDSTPPDNKLSAPSDSARGQTTRQMAVGSVWVMATRWGMRLIGVLSTIILARLLSPHDFGLVAMAMLAVVLLQVFSESGQRLALIRLRTVTREHYDTAWTISVVIGIVIALAIVCLSPLVADYFNEPRLILLLAILALRPFLGGLENIGVVEYRRNLRFDLEFRFLFWPKVVSFFTTVGCAILWRDYWALVVGILTGQAASLFLSYVMHAYRPRFSLAKIGELWSFSYWTLAGSIAAFGAEKTDELVIGRLFDTSQLGLYSVTSSVASMPIDELVGPPSRALYSGFSHLQDDKDALRKSYVDALSALHTLGIAASFGVAAIAEDMVAVLLGEKWQSGAPLMPWLAIAAALFGLSRTNSMLLVAIGKAKWVAIRSWLFLIVLVIALLVGQYYAGLLGVAIGRLTVTVLLYLGMQIAVCYLLSVKFGEIVEILWRPMIAAATMFLAIRYGDLARHLNIAEPVLRLATNVMVGGVTFVSVQAFLWFLARRPLGVEFYIVALLKEKLLKARP